MKTDSYFQFHGFVKMLYCGLMLGLSYDLLKKLIFKTFPDAVSDIIFSLSTLCVFLSALYAVDKLNLEYHYVFGCIVGWAIYFYAFSPAVSKLFSLFCKKLSKISAPLFVLFKKISDYAVSFFYFLASPLIKFYKQTKKKLKNIFMLYNKYKDER